MHEGKTSQSKSSAAGQYLGFALQPVRLCYYLLSAPDDARVSLEYYDDVAVHYANNDVLLEQTKSALAHNPLTDWSEDFWKTVSNWLDILIEHDICHNAATFRYYVTPFKQIGTICTLFNEAKNQIDTAALVVKLKESLEKLKSPPRCMSYINRFLNATQQEQEAIATKMTIINKAEPIGLIRELLKPAIPDNLIELTIQFAIGMAKEKADNLIRNKRNAMISVREFRNEFLTFVQKNNIPGYLPRLNSHISKSDAEEVLQQRPVFIKQLQLVDSRESQQLHAISDLLRTNSDLTIWAEHGLIFEQNIYDWHDSLIRHYDATCDEVDVCFSDTPSIDKGKIIYSRCSTKNISLDHYIIPDYFTNGGFNILADELKLGWHPDYIELIGKINNEK